MLLARYGIFWIALKLSSLLFNRLIDLVQGQMMQIELERGSFDSLSAAASNHTLEQNRRVWGSWDWSRYGEEWTVSEKWKQTLIDEVMMPNVPRNSTVLEIGPGAGRWSESLQRVARRLILVDISEKCLEICRQRFRQCINVEYFVTSGTDLRFIPDGTVDFVWSFDVFVHLNPIIIGAYLEEVERVLGRRGRGLIHHPGAGRKRQGWRSPVSTRLFAEMLENRGLVVVWQRDAWGEKGEHSVRGYQDCLTLFEKPDSGTSN